MRWALIVGAVLAFVGLANHVLGSASELLAGIEFDGDDPPT
jgi:hypothetical protein